MSVKSTPKPEKGKCRFCGSPLTHSFVNLGMSPLCQDRLSFTQLKEMEPFYPLHAYVCDKCFLVQVEEFASPEEIYRDYAYYSSYSDTWMEHCRQYVDLVVDKFNLDKRSLVVELASNDGSLLELFMAKEVPVLGVEPAETVADHALKLGVRTEKKFFGEKVSQELMNRYGKADLILGNNVLAHVPDINDFVAGMKIFLKSEGVITMEFPLLMNLVEKNEFDTIYHEHFSYLSLNTVERIFLHHGLTLFDAEEFTTHGGSVRIYARHTEDEGKQITKRYMDLKNKELHKGINQLNYYSEFEKKVHQTKRDLLDFLIQAKRNGKSIVGYGAPGKGNTLLNYCGISTDFLDYTVDRNPHKWGYYLPGSLIPIHHPDKIKETKPDFVLILPWNLKEEIMESQSFITEWGGKFVVPIPKLEILDPKSELQLS